MRTFVPHERVIVRKDEHSVWKADFFSRVVELENDEYLYVCVGGNYKHCLPVCYNTYLLGTTRPPMGVPKPNIVFGKKVVAWNTEEDKTEGIFMNRRGELNYVAVKAANPTINFYRHCELHEWEDE